MSYYLVFQYLVAPSSHFDLTLVLYLIHSELKEFCGH